MLDKIAGDELVAGDYTFWQGDTQLSASMGMGNMMMGGEASATFTIVKGGNQFGNVGPIAITPTE